MISDLFIKTNVPNIYKCIRYEVHKRSIWSDELKSSDKKSENADQGLQKEMEPDKNGIL